MPLGGAGLGALPQNPNGDKLLEGKGEGEGDGEGEGEGGGSVV